MKRLTFILLLATLSCGGSGSDSPSAPNTPRVTTLSITPGGATLNAIGATAQLLATIRDQNGQVMSSTSLDWITTDATIATVNSSGLVTAQGPGAVTITARVGGVSDAVTITVLIPPSITTVSAVAGTVTWEYSHTLEADGGDGTYQWTLIEGELPAGLTLGSDGVISGTPTAGGESTFTVRVSSGGLTAEKQFSITIVYPPVRVTTDRLPAIAVGRAYNQPFEAAGGDGNYAWTITIGTLPAGLTMGSDGVISGTPEALEVSTFTVQVSSAGLVSTARGFTITVVSADLGFGLGLDQFELIAAGAFEMGNANGPQRPVHTVTLTQPFYMQKTEMTEAQWFEVMGSYTTSDRSCGDTCPVGFVSWDEVQVFLTALNAANPGANYRLPTEAQWEYSARAGTTGDFGGTGIADEMGWTRENSGNNVHPVGLKQPNDWALYDMHGNAGEFVQDWWSDYVAGAVTDPTGPAGPLNPDAPDKVLRGGGAVALAFFATSAARTWIVVTVQGPGFRLVRDGG